MKCVKRVLCAFYKTRIKRVLRISCVSPHTLFSVWGETHQPRFVKRVKGTSSCKKCVERRIERVL